MLVGEGFADNGAVAAGQAAQDGVAVLPGGELGGAFNPAVLDGKGTLGLTPPKSNWARAIAVPPFLAYPLVGAIAYTFGGLATDDRARALRDGAPIPGLFAAGEITGHFYATAPNAVSVLRAFVFGRIAGREAVESLFR